MERLPSLLCIERRISTIEQDSWAMVSVQGKWCWSSNHSSFFYGKGKQPENAMGEK